MAFMYDIFWASRDCDDSKGGYSDEIVIWRGDPPWRDRYEYTSDISRTDVWETLSVANFKSLHGWTVPKSRCVQVTDPRIKRKEK